MCAVALFTIAQTGNKAKSHPQESESPKSVYPWTGSLLVGSGRQYHLQHMSESQRGTLPESHVRLLWSVIHALEFNISEVQEQTAFILRFWD